MASPDRLLCVYCSSSRELEPKYYAAGEQIGRELAGRGWGLVYGGGHAGVMGAVARAASTAGAHVVGVIPHFMHERELTYHAADELVTVDSMRERKRVMAERADAFIALPGGIGTLEELSEIMVERSLNLTRKPLVLFNQDGFYDDFLRFLDRMVRERFKTARLAQTLAVATRIDEVWPLLDQAAAPEVDPLWRPRS
jgi:cytokinin riboside 5'-monophosphate phosphoribohydrolase